MAVEVGVPVGVLLDLLETLPVLFASYILRKKSSRHSAMNKYSSSFNISTKSTRL